jgi:hypothetical protein
MKRFVETEDRRQGVPLPEYLDGLVAEWNSVQVIDVADAANGSATGTGDNGPVAGGTSAPTNGRTLHRPGNLPLDPSFVVM